MPTVQELIKLAEQQKKKTQELVRLSQPAGATLREAQAERLASPKPVLKPVVKPTWTEAKAPVTAESQARDFALAQRVASTTPGAFGYGVARGVSMPVTATAKLLGYQESPEEAAVRTLAESKRLTAQMDASKGMGAPNIIQGRSVPPEMVGRVVGSVLPFSAAESAVGRVLPSIAGQGIKQTALRGAVAGGALQGLEEAGQGKRGMELAGSVALGTALGAGADIGLGYLAKAIRGIRSGKTATESIAEVVSETPEALSALKQELNLPDSTPVEEVERILVAESVNPQAAARQLKAEQSMPLAQGVNIPKVREQLSGAEPVGAVIKPQQAVAPQVRPVVPEPQVITPQVKSELSTSIPERMATDSEIGVAPKVTPGIEAPVTTKQTRTFERQEMIDAITEPGMRERGLSKNLATDINRPQETIDSFNDDPIFYKQLSNKSTLDKAQSILEKGYDSALEEYRKIGRTFEAHKVPLGIKLSDEAVARGDFDTSREILAGLAEELTSAGQFSQAANILRRSNDPQAATLFIQRQLAKLNKEGAETYGKKWTDINLTDDELQAIQAAAGDKELYDKTMEDIYNRIAQQIPVSNREKFDAWRRIAMLANPRTHVRNIVGNALMATLEKASDTLGTAIERVARIPVGERTKAVNWSADKNIVDAVEQSWNAAKDDLTKATKYEISGLRAFNREKPIFKTKAIEYINNLSKSTLEAEDVFFMKRAYQDALGQYMKANKLPEPTPDAIAFAKEKALEATFRQANGLASFIENAKKKGGVGGMLVEAAVPFSKTPANILMRGVDYSPFGLTKLLATKGKTAAEKIDILSKGLTGSGMFGLGMYLASMGYARGDYTTQKREGLAELTGEQPMSIITPDGSYTFDWAQPVAVPLAMGIAAYEQIQKKNPDAAKVALEAAAAGGDAIFNMSMLQNIKELLGGGYGSPAEAIINLPKSYVEQAFPSVFGQLARIADPVKRSTYADTEFQKSLNMIKAKTPGVSQTLYPKLDVLGREIKAGSVPVRIINNMLSPGMAKSKSKDPVVLELSRLFESEKNTEILPRVAPKELQRTVKGTQEKKTLTDKQLYEFQRAMGGKNESDLKRLFNSSEYKFASDVEKAKLVAKIVKKNYEEQKDKMFGE